jgi:hypothetical protein
MTITTVATGYYMPTEPRWEYAGFWYIIRREPDGRLVAEPEPGQHPAAAKDKHRRAAVETYEEQA